MPGFLTVVISCGRLFLQHGGTAILAICLARMQRGPEEADVVHGRSLPVTVDLPHARRAGVITELLEAERIATSRLLSMA